MTTHTPPPFNPPAKQQSKRIDTTFMAVASGVLLLVFLFSLLQSVAIVFSGYSRTEGLEWVNWNNGDIMSSGLATVRVAFFTFFTFLFYGGGAACVLGLVYWFKSK